MDKEQIIVTIPLVIVGLAAMTSLISFRYDYPDTLKKLSVLWVINFCFDLAGHIIYYSDAPNLWLYNIYFWIQFLALAWLYDKQIANKYVRRSIRLFLVVFPLLVAGDSMVSGIGDLQTIVIVAGGVFMIFLAASYFRQLYLSEETETITRDPWLWFSCGILIQFGGTTPYLGMMNYLNKQYPEFSHYYYLYGSNSFTTLLNFLIIVGYLCRRNYQKSR